MNFMKLVIASAIVLGATVSAQANDSSTPFINVQGVNPMGKTAFEPIEFYGGETKKFFDAMPTILFAGGDISADYRYVELRSKAWTVSFNCSREYVSPVDNKDKSDYYCAVVAWNNADSQDEGDSFEVEGFLPAIVHGEELAVKGINPNHNLPGDYVSFYGKDSVKMATATNGGPLYISSKAYTVYLDCVKDYENPLTKKAMNDYACTVGFYKN